VSKPLFASDTKDPLILTDKLPPEEWSGFKDRTDPLDNAGPEKLPNGSAESAPFPKERREEEKLRPKGKLSSPKAEAATLSEPVEATDSLGQDREKQFRLAKYFSSIAKAVIFASCLLLAAVMSGQVEDTIYERVVEDTIMIMDNLNYQMYTRFLNPLHRSEGDSRLSQPAAYNFLSNVIADTVYGFDISRVALYDGNYGMKIYSSDSPVPVVIYRPNPNTGEPIPYGEFADPLGPYLEAVVRAYLPSPPTEEELFTTYPFTRQYWRPPGSPDRELYVNYLKERTVIVRQNGSFLLGGFFPRGQFAIRCFKAMEDYTSYGISGVLEVTRDLTQEYRQIAAMQYVALAIAVGATIFLTFVLRLVVARGEAIINQKNAEQASLNERLHQVERLVNLGRMVATVSHEIRNPLGIINSSADFLSSSLKETPKLARLAGAIVDESERLSRIVTDFLDFARPQEPRFLPVVVEEILEEIFVLLEVDMARNGVELEEALRDDPGPIMADAALLHRAFMNILVNAIQAMPDGGQLTVSTGLEQNKDLPGDEGSLVITVMDTGQGILPDTQTNIFKPFFTTKTKGTGLGLVLVRNIVESHGGRLKLQNREGGPEEHGLVVTISLPLAFTYISPVKSAPPDNSGSQTG
jgi:signal transduction histidine kinase